MQILSPIYVPEILLHHISPFLITYDLVSLKKTNQFFNLFFSHKMLLDHLKKDGKKNQKVAYTYWIREWNYPKLQLFFTDPTLKKCLSNSDYNDGLKMFCNGTGIEHCLEKVKWMKKHGKIDFTHGKNALLRHGIRHDQFHLVDHLINNGADPLMFAANALDWLVSYGSNEMIRLVLRDAIEDEVEKTLFIAIRKNKVHPFRFIKNFFLFLHDDYATDQKIFTCAVENQSMDVLRLFLNKDHNFILQRPFSVLEVSNSLVAAVQCDDRSMVKLFCEYSLQHTDHTTLVSVLENFQRAFFWIILKRRWILKSIVLRSMETLTEMGQELDVLNTRVTLLSGQMDLERPVDYLFLLCYLIQDHEKLHSFTFFQELNIEFPFANALTAKEREYLLWFCVYHGQVRFFELAIQPLRGNCRPISTPFQVPMRMEAAYSEHLSMEVQGRYTLKTMFHFIHCHFQLQLWVQTIIGN